MSTSCTTTASSGFFRSFKPSRAVPTTKAQPRITFKMATLTRPVIKRAGCFGGLTKLMVVDSPDELFAADDGDLGQPHPLGGGHQVSEQFIFRVLVGPDMNFWRQIHFGG